MAVAHILYNPAAGNGSCTEDAKLLEMLLPDAVRFFDMTRITNYAAFFGGMAADDYIVVAGGDGTLNRFVNDTAGLAAGRQILYFAAGTGNDFARDLGKGAFSQPFPITQYLDKLPWVEVNGGKYRFINGVGFGLDGYCCMIGDELKKTPGRKIDYSVIAMKGLLFHFEPRNAEITVDGRRYCYKKVWIAPTMHGRFYGGGMMAAPGQNRSARDGRLSLLMMHGAGRLRTLCMFPGIFKGTHVRHARNVTVHTGREITVEFDRPTPLQIDGETILNVTRYTVMAPTEKIP